MKQQQQQQNVFAAAAALLAGDGENRNSAETSSAAANTSVGNETSEADGVAAIAVASSAPTASRGGATKGPNLARSLGSKSNADVSTSG